jgi:DNA-binding response OmpR family regulator
MSIKILLVEDDELFCETIEEFLSDLGYEVDVAVDVNSATELSFEHSYDLYILDINLPDATGLELLKSLRSADDNTSAIFLTSYKDSDTLKDGFKVGADDFLRKPVDLDELELRIKALLKRAGKQLNTITLKDNIIFNPHTKSISENGENIKVPAKVIDLLELFLANNKKQIITKEMIIEKLWSDACEYSEGSIRVYINNLKKLFPDGAITNLKSIGYKFEF